MECGKKLMDKLDAYDDMEGEVDFPNWWQAKLIVSKEYLQKAYHYLDSEEKTEESVNEATSLWKHFDAKMKLQDEIMDLEYDMKMITKDIAQLHKDMEQEAEPEGGPKATRYGRDIEKKEKEYKKKKAEFKKLMKKLDKLEQY